MLYTCVLYIILYMCTVFYTIHVYCMLYYTCVLYVILYMCTVCYTIHVYCMLCCMLQAIQCMYFLSDQAVHCSCPYDLVVAVKFTWKPCCNVWHVTHIATWNLQGFLSSRVHVHVHVSVGVYQFCIFFL